MMFVTGCNFKIMRNYRALLAVGLIFAVALPGRTLDLVKDGKPGATIVIADDAGVYQKWAAQWLQEYIKKAAGAQLEIVAESKSPAGTLISVGHTILAKKAGLTTDNLKYDGCRLRVKDNVLYLIGRDYVPPKDAKPDAYPDLKSGRPQGTVRAVAMFLEDVAGVRWFLPGPEGIFMPNAMDLSVPDTLDRKFEPYLAFCFTGYDQPLAYYANNGRIAMKILFFGGHSWYAHVSAREDADDELLKNVGDTNYFKEHPEYFRMDENGRRTAGGGHLCTSNPDVRKIMVEKMRKSFDEGYDVIELGQSDGWQPCLCPQCQKEFGDGKIPVSLERPAERIWVMHKWIIDELARSHPDKKVLPIIYGPAAFPSKKFDRLPDNVIAELATRSPDDETWRNKFNACTIYDSYVWEEDCVPTCFVPALDPEWLQKRMRLYRKCGVIGLSGGGTGVFWGLGGPTFYAYAKLAGDPDVNIDRLLTEYCQGVYGESGWIMERFFKLFHSRSGQTLACFSHASRMEFANGYPAEEAFTALYPPAIVGQMDRLLKKAEETAKSERARGWLKRTRDDFDGLRTIAGMFAAKRAFELQPTREMLLLVKDNVEAFEQWRMRILAYSKDPAYIERWFPKYYYLCNDLISGGVHAKWNLYYYRQDLVKREVAAIVKGEKSVRGKGIGSNMGHREINEPITWDFDKMTANLGKARGEKKIHVPRTIIKPGTDGALDPAAWANAPALPFEVYKGRDSRLAEDTGTTVRLLYDDERLYVRYECREPNIDNLKLKPVGRDGNVYALDEAELFLNPECSNRKMMHFMAAPVKDARYDERKGYIDDPLDQRYSAVDTAWNPAWTYTYMLAKEKKLWILEMAVPFKSLGVGAPKAGAVWTANFARVRRTGDSEELSCWIAEDFGNPEIFGELIFGDKEEKPNQQPQAKSSGKSELTSKNIEKVGRGVPALTRGEHSRTSEVEGAAEPSDEDRLTQRVRPTIGKSCNFIGNGGFETADENGNPKNWRLESYQVPQDQKFMKYCAFSGEKPHRGKVSLKVDYRDIGGYTGLCSQIILSCPLDRETVKRLRGKEVVLSAWLNYEYLDENCRGYYYPGPIVSLRVGSKDKYLEDKEIPNILLNHASLASFGIAGAAQATERWNKIWQKGKIPPDADNVTVRIEQVAIGGEKHAERNATALFLDDVSLELAEKGPPELKP